MLAGSDRQFYALHMSLGSQGWVGRIEKAPVANIATPKKLAYPRGLWYKTRPKIPV
ncbi:hypothetical protein GCM10022278_29030 [Allohahella marinimesophila]|uniref:Uncharacterized protein n=1 Tax=Allohahella marinimesophila TaxID=1054972 RepID=A0ABP7PQ80_9GAMM